MSKTENINGIDFTPINNNYYGNPRYVVHFFSFLTDDERKTYGIDTSGYLFDLALNRSRKLSGKKYRGKSYGGAIVLSSYNLRDTAQKIQAIMASI
jgi:hypothetical protein